MTSPTEWVEVGLGDVCEFKYGKSLPAALREPGTFPVFGSNGVVGEHREALTSGPTIIVGRKGSFGEVNYSDTACWPIDTTYFVDATSTKADLRWLAHLLPTLRLTELNRAAAVPGLNREDAYRRRCLLPPIDEQRRIAAILDQADGLRAKRREALAHLDDLARSIFVDLFGHVHDVQSWPRQPLKDLVEVITKGTTPTSVGFQFTESGVPFLRVQNLVNGTVDFAPGALFIDRTTHVALKRSRILAGDILVSIAGTIGRTSIVPLDAQEMNCNQAVAIVRLKAGVNRNFVRAWLSSSDAHRQLSASTVTGTISNLSLSQLGLLQIIQPPASLQDEFSDRLGSATALKDRCAKSQLRIESLFASLQSRAFAGEL